MNHIAIKVESTETVNRLQSFLELKKIPVLYKADYYGPTYYVVYFEDPDRFKWEVGTNAAIQEKL